jgi:hypothetical protein
MLAVYPFLSYAVPLCYFIVRPEKLPRPTALPHNDEKDAEGFRVAVIVTLIFYGSLFVCTLLLRQFLFLDPQSAGLTTHHWLSSILRGGYVGMSWAGIWLWAWTILSSPHRLRREVPGLSSAIPTQLLVWIGGAFSVELWRVLTIAAVQGDRHSASYAVIASSVTYALAFLSNGLERSALAFIEGIILGVLFVWQGSFVAPLAGHLAVQGVYLWGIGQSSRQQRSKTTWWRRQIQCPVCGVQLNRLQIKLTEAFECPDCHKRLSVSDEYRSRMRLVAVVAYMSLFGCSLALLFEQVPENLALWVLWPIAWGAGTSGIFLYQKVFPPRLQYGEPHFIRLDIQGS